MLSKVGGRPGFSSDLLVQEMSTHLDEAVRGFPHSSPLRIAFPLVHPDAPSFSYSCQALVYGDRPGVETEIWVPTPDGEFELVTTKEALLGRVSTGLYTPKDDRAAVKLIQGFNERAELDGNVPLFPGATPEGEEEMRDVIAVELDHDSVSPHNPIAPTTPTGMARLAEFIARQPLTDIQGRIAVLGYGPLVGQPMFDQVLPEAGVDMSRVDLFRDRKEIDAGIKRLEEGEFKLVFSAFRAAARITDSAPGTILVDVGYALGKDGRPYGNAHPDLLAGSAQEHGDDMENGYVVTSFRHGGGPVTIAEVYQRAAAYKTRKLQAAGELALSSTAI